MIILNKVIKISSFIIRCRSHLLSSTYALPPFKYARNYKNQVAIEDEFGEHTYTLIHKRSQVVASRIKSLTEDSESQNTQKRIAIFCPNNVGFVVSLFGIWMLGHTECANPFLAVPLSSLHPKALLEYYLKKAEVNAVVYSETLRENIEAVCDGCTKICLEQIETSTFNVDTIEHIEQDDHFYTNKKHDALILFTSGSTGQPKGVTLTFHNLQAQVNCLLKAWAWNEADILLHSLPLYHSHGLINGLLCCLTIGARCIMIPKFNAALIWETFVKGYPTLFMGVPTMYAKLIDFYKKNLSTYEDMVHQIKDICSYQMSGSAPLPEPFFQEWQNITNHRLVERYGMTETGMILSNPLKGERRAGFVGTPLPWVHVRIVEWDMHRHNFRVLVESNMYTNTVVQTSEDGSLEGELIVKSPGVFHRYWGEDSAKKDYFTFDGWFCTGDKVRYENGLYKILGRFSVDIIKSGGYKLSAIEIEKWLLLHPNVRDACIVGVSDLTWGQKVVALIEPVSDNIDVEELKTWLAQFLPYYALPAKYKIVTSLPRNAMGKINKKEIVSMFL